MSGRSLFFYGGVVCLSVLIFTANAGAFVYYVDPAAAGSGDGSSWANAFHYLQDALGAAAYGDQIRVAQGVYRPDRTGADPTGNRNRESSFDLVNGVEMYGGFPAGGGPTVARRPLVFETILCGDLEGDDIPVADPRIMCDEASLVFQDNSYHVVTALNVDPNARLDGFIITAGNANGTPPVQQKGGGMYCASDDPAQPHIYGCRFIGNAAIWGGGLYNEDASTTVACCAFRGNGAVNYGGGVYNINFFNSGPAYANCTFSFNVTSGRGGGICNVSSDCSYVNCLVNANFAEDRGGGAYNMYQGCTPDYINCTFICNEALIEGGAMRDYAADTVLVNSIFWGNIAPVGPQLAARLDVCSMDISYCDVQGGLADINAVDNAYIIWGTGNIDAYPMFDVSEEPAECEPWAFRLMPGSPCLDAGDSLALPVDTADADNDGDTSEIISVDFRGYLRTVDDPDAPDLGNPPAPMVDMGVYERAVCGDPDHLTPLGDLDGNCKVDLFDFARLTAFYGAASCGEPDYCEGADLDQDGDVDDMDLALLAGNWLVCTHPDCD